MKISSFCESTEIIFPRQSSVPANWTRKLHKSGTCSTLSCTCLSLTCAKICQSRSSGCMKLKCKRIDQKTEFNCRSQSRSRNNDMHIVIFTLLGLPFHYFSEHKARCRKYRDCCVIFGLEIENTSGQLKKRRFKSMEQSLNSIPYT